MSSVMIRCPTTGRPVSTGIETEPAVFARLPLLAARMLCPACAQEHAWNTGAAWLAGEPRVAEPVASAAENEAA